jgi:very-short-patch-repair endonuclease
MTKLIKTPNVADSFFSEVDTNQKINPSLRVELICAPTVSYAAVQNNVPLVQTVRIENTSHVDIKNIGLVISANPTFMLGQRFHFDCLLAGEVRTLGADILNLMPDHTYFAALNEAELGRVEVKAIAADGTEAHNSNAIEVLAHNEWGGTRGLPELLAAFVQPNSLAVDRLLGMASDLLKGVDSTLSLDGYQSKNRERVWKQVNAVFKILNTQALQYCPPPASFESTGQKIRSSERILDARISTCLDSAIMMAACFEQAGLNPVIFFKEAHAWVGVWLIDNCFPTPIIDCVQSVRKRVDSGELLMLEATAITQNTRPTMEWARTTANAYLEEETTTFSYAVDIKRARQAHIRALKEKTTTTEPNPVDGGISPDSKGLTIEPMPPLPTLDPSMLPVTGNDKVDTPQGRLNRWKSKLLDLTLRNKLLNFKPGKTFLKIVCANPNILEDSLATEGEFKLAARPALMQDSDPRSAELFFRDKGMTPVEAHAQAVLANRELVFEVPANEFDARLTDIYRAGKNTLEETGANTLYISLGMLHWKESADSETVLKAPLLLVPVSLKRGAVGAGIRLVRHDDETIFNPTLLQKLALDFEISLPFTDGHLPTDEKGVDVGLILQKVRMSVAELRGFEVRPDCYLGNFSFTKYVMWKDLNSRVEDLSQSRVVNHLINNKGLAFVDDSKSVDPRELDDLYSPQSLFTPLIADSSQLAVVCTASHGKNMVVEGPPGTGKSQTITNMIAHFLASGKTVLFVAEKMAALEVVHKRLSSLGLAEFCLELHSSKAKKSEIAKEFVRTLNIAHSHLQSDWEKEAEKLSALRNQLSDLVKVLHREHRNGMSVYVAMGVCIANTDTTAASLQWSDADTHSVQELDALTDLVAVMAALAGQLGNIAGHPLSEIGQTQWTPSWQDKLMGQCLSLPVSVQVLNQALAAFSKLTALDPQALSLHDLASLDRLAGTLMQACEVPSQSVALAHQQASRQRLQTLIAHGHARNQAWGKLSENYAPDVKTLDAQSLQLQWRAANRDWILKRWFAKRNVTAQIQLFNLQGVRLNAHEVSEFLASLGTLNEEDKYFSDNNSFGQEILGTAFTGISTNWEAAQTHLNWMESFSHALSDVCHSRTEELTQLRSHFKSIICDQAEMFSAGSVYFTLAANLRNAYREFSSQWHELTALVSPRTALCGGDKVPGILTSASSLVASWQRSKIQLQPWCVWQLNKTKAYAQGLQGLVNCVEFGDVKLGELGTFFDFSYRNWWIKKMVDKEPLLSNFSGATHEHKIVEFKKLDEQFQQLTQNYIVAKLRGHIPSEAEIKGELSTEIAFLRREAQKQKQHKSIRQVINQSRTVLPRVKPCLLMSPLSVAQYLDAGHAQFDVVIFDEASQIPTWDAVGAIARGKQLVCVGDPKQLPPTNFFNAADSEGVINEDDIEEMESILDECLSIGMMPCTLDWHYRSKSEGLITFSNMQYYDNRLITFPSPVTQDQSVRFVAIDGIYDAGKSRTNRKEADAIVDAIAEHYLSGKGKELSIGVITFNSTQQALIEKLIDAKRLGTPKLDIAISESLVEPFFVKNLENVQGDERDIILFSITFGKDINGKISMNFGPMNKEGGHRRLNVAASRARHEVRIFSSLRPEHIDLSRTKARGVADLKAYLDFAINGPRVLAKQALPTGREPDSPFEVAVIKTLRDHGWEVHPQVGVSGYRLDLGVVNPHARGRYLLGVECDGATYHSAASARDRDRLRQMILEGLGWKIHRIWSTDWWINPEIPMQKLLDRLSQLEMQAAIDYGSQCTSSSCELV